MNDSAHNDERLVAPERLARLAEWMAYAAGLAMLALIGISVISIVGRAMFAKPVLGDFELVERVTAVCVAWCLPYCQLARGHVVVDIFTLNAPKSIQAILDAVASLATAFVAALLVWRTSEGVLDLRDSGETSMILRLPEWIPVGLMVPGIAVFFVCCLSTAFVRTNGRGA